MLSYSTIPHITIFLLLQIKLFGDLDSSTSSCRGTRFSPALPPLSRGLRVGEAKFNEISTSASYLFIRGLGFEPRLMASKATVLPLDDPRLIWVLIVQELYHNVHLVAHRFRDGSSALRQSDLVALPRPAEH